MRRTSSSAKRFARTTAAFAITIVLCQTSILSVASAVTLSFGANSVGQNGTGIGNILVAMPIDMTNLISKTVTQVVAGGEHSLLLANDGTVYSFGLNLGGRTGQGTSSGNTNIATPINTSNLAGRRIKQLAAGSSHSLLLADDGTVLSFGFNNPGQTGLGTASGNTLVATPIDMTNLAGKKITQVAAGDGFSLLLAEDGVVFSFGFNADGRTGQGTSNGNTLVATPINTTNLAGRTIKQVAAGNGHSLLLADDDTVLSFGFNGNGQTGLGTTSGNTLVARPIDMTNLAGRKIAQVEGGGEHSLLLADDGTVFSFGLNTSGQTGLGTDIGMTLVATPIAMTNVGGRHITRVTAGLGHSLLLADDGSVFAFGENGQGRTGQGTSVGHTLVATPIVTSNLVGFRGVDISAGSGHSLVLAVPEPGGSVLLLLAGLALHTARRRNGARNRF